MQAGHGVRLVSLLLFVDLLDELAGVGSVASPDIERDLGLSYVAFTLVLFTAPQVLALVAEPPLLLLAAHRPHQRKLLTVGGLVMMALGLLGAAAAPSGAMLALALGLAFIGSGLGVNLAQATLMDAAPDRRDSMMTRWALLGELGDLGTPLLLAGLGALTLGWRSAFAVVGASLMLHAL
jgi:MFS family permease